MWGTTRPESFPRMWDQLLVRSVIDLRCRIIPTYVGSTRWISSTSCSSSNHSHVCGINVFRLETMPWFFESFPRMWDQLARPLAVGPGRRIIPTYVGSTRRRVSAVYSSSNHSHVCGINGAFAYDPAVAVESFPRMWDQPCRL